MKTMTCAQLGGPCEHAHRGESADEVIQAQDRHLKEAVAAGDATHEQAAKEMKGRWLRPRSPWTGTSAPRRPLPNSPRIERWRSGAQQRGRLRH